MQKSSIAELHPKLAILMHSVVDVSVNSFTKFLKHLPSSPIRPLQEQRSYLSLSYTDSLVDRNNLPDIWPAPHIFRLLLKSVGLPLPQAPLTPGSHPPPYWPVPDTDGDGCVFCCNSDRPCVLWRKHGG